MKKSQLSLKWLEVFQLIARSGSVKAAADESGLSISTVSHHLSKLEISLGRPLFDHSCRPMRLTPTGAGFLRQIDDALRLIRAAEREAQNGTTAETRNLSLALVEDFDSQIAPELARALSATMPNCTFRHLTRPSHEILNLLRTHDIDIGVATRPLFDQPDFAEYPLLRDPFVLAVPAGQSAPPEQYINGTSGLPLLRYSQSQIIGSLIEAQLNRLHITLPNRNEFESNQSIMNMVAEGCGWAITTPACYARARQFHREVRLVPFPGKEFSRTLSAFTLRGPEPVAASSVIASLRHLIQTRAIAPVIHRMPWLASQFYVVTHQNDGTEVSGFLRSTT